MTAINNIKKHNILWLVVLFLGPVLNGFTQSIPASTTTGSNPCAICTPPNWFNFGGTPDMSNATTAATSGTSGGGTNWTNGPLPLPPNGHQNWITIRDIGAGGAEESVGTDLTGLTIGREYEVVAYTLSAIGGYSGRYIDKLDFQVGANPREIISPINRDVDGEWGVSRFRFTASNSTEQIAFYPGSDASGTTPATFESVNISVTLNAINTIPLTEDKDVVTSAGLPVSVNVLEGAQDFDAGQDVVVSSIDLDPSTPGIQDTVTTTEGTWQVNHTNGDVTFSPSSGFNGIATIDYTIQDDFTLDGNPSPGTSNPKSITVTSTTADVQINKHGPPSAQPGSTISYRIYISNNGFGNATNVIVQDPAVSGFTLTGITCEAGDGTGSSALCPTSLTVGELQGSGVVIPSLPAGSSVLLTVTGTVSNTLGSFTNTATVQYGDDPDGSNNSSSIETEILEDPCATTVYTLDPEASIDASQVTFGEDGGVITLVYTRTSGAPLEGIGESFTMEVEYSDLNNPLTDNKWEAVAQGLGSRVALLPLTDGVSDLYTDLPAINLLSHTWLMEPKTTDRFFTSRIVNGTILPLGDFTLSIPNYPTPSFSKILTDQFETHTVGNTSIVGDNSVTGFWLKPIAQTDIYTNSTTAMTNIFSMQPGQNYVYRYAAFGDGATNGYSNGGVRGLQFENTNSVTFGYDDTPVISSILPQSQTMPAGTISSVITVTASKANTATDMTYQWYRNTINSNTGGTPIPGATSENFAPPIPAIGTVYYYVEVHGDGLNCMAVSEAVAINVDLDSDNDGILDCDERRLSGEIDTSFSVNGHAVKVGTNEVRLTSTAQSQSGQLWSKGKVDFSESFIISYEANFGTNKAGADGIATVFHNDPAGSNAKGDVGGGIGAQGIRNGIVLELDTYRNTGEISGNHGHIWRSQNGASLSTPVSLVDIEDGNWHEVIVTWDATTQTISYTVDGALAGSYTGDLVNDIFGTDKVHFGYTAATGALTNEHRIRFPEGMCNLPLGMDADGDGIPDYLDLDSDNDGCPDALEGDGDIQRDQLNPDGSINSPEDTNGVPELANGGQGIGNAYNPYINCLTITNPMLPSKTSK